ncbi:unnamed protein product, partial [Rotaria magnacalcarata]
MPRARSNERIVVLQTDGRGNILDYDVVDRPNRSSRTEKSSSVRRSTRSKQSPKVSQTEANYDDDDEEEKVVEDEENYEVHNSRNDTSYRDTPDRKSYRDSDRRRDSSRRRVRYVRPKSKVKIFQRKVDWSANSKVDARNDDAMEKILSAPKKKIYDEKPSWSVKSKIDTHNEEVVETILRAPKPE